MAVLPTHNLIWLKPHAGRVAGQPLSFKEKIAHARLRRLAFKGIVGKAEDHPEMVEAYCKMKEDEMSKALSSQEKLIECSKELTKEEEAKEELTKEKDSSGEETLEELLELPKEEEVKEEPKSKSKGSRKRQK